MKAALALAFVCSVCCVPAHAQIYQCTDANGKVGYQDRACPVGQKQKILDVPSHAPPGYVPPPVATVAAPAATANPLPAAAQASMPTPLPVMYMCVGAVNGKQYITRSPPPPYLAPLGLMGYPPQSLARAYGTRGGAGVSAPELSKQPRVGGPRIATGMTEVQDFCLPATHAQVCGYVRKAYDENHSELRRAMPSEQPPLKQREQQLSAQLKNC